MKPKTCIVLSVLAVVLRALALIAVLMLTVLQEPVKRFFGVNEEIAAIRTVPWSAIVQALIWLVLSLVILLVLRKRPGRGGTIALTVVSAVLYVIFGIVVSGVLQIGVTQAIALQGAEELASSSALSGALGMVTPILSTPASILSLLALGGACGKDLRVQNTAE